MLREIILLHVLCIVLPCMLFVMKGAQQKKNIAKNTHYRLFPTLSRSPYVCIGRGIMQKYTNNNIALKHKPQ